MIAVSRLALILAIAAFLAGESSAQTGPSDDDLRLFAVHINRTPPPPWSGYGVYLGNGLVLTAAHVPGNVDQTKPRVLMAGRDLPASLVKRGRLEDIDLTLLSVDPANLPLRWRMSRLPLCTNNPFAGEAVVVATPEGTARSRVLPAAAVPRNLRARFDTVIGDVATTGNSGSGVFDAWKQCLLGVISRKISSVGARGLPGQASPKAKDIAKYFVPVHEINAFLPVEVSF
ncbi:MAG: trypsin-like peptidase domain-containing protein [Hyphomicrobiales bacterium]|nr:trypsin-like peptidase domain-containing protein [Hyphomicrobiales bacterium]